MRCQFIAKVVSYEDDQEKYYIDNIMGFAENYSEAAESIENYYRSDLISIKELKLLEPTNSEILIVPESVVEAYNQEDYLRYSQLCDEEGRPIDG